jgi:hypothetical protein
VIDARFLAVGLLAGHEGESPKAEGRGSKFKKPRIVA